MEPKRLIYIALPLALLLCVLLLPPSNESVSGLSVTPDHVITVRCNIAEKPCNVRLGSLHFSANLTPAGLPVLTPLVLTLEQLPPEVISDGEWLVWFSGRDMDMGVHLMTPPLSAEHAPAVMRFNGMIPVCAVDSTMTWLLNTQLVWSSEVYHFVFELPSTPHKLFLDSKNEP